MTLNPRFTDEHRTLTYDIKPQVYRRIAKKLTYDVKPQVYRRIANKLTTMENHRTQKDHDNHLSFKIYLFEFVNYYGTLFYIAFFKGK